MNHFGGIKIHVVAWLWLQLWNSSNSHTQVSKYHNIPLGRKGDIKGLLEIGTGSSPLRPALPWGDVVLEAPGIGRPPCHGEERPDKNPLSLQRELPGVVASLDCWPKDEALLLLLSQPDVGKPLENGVDGEAEDERMQSDGGSSVERLVDSEIQDTGLTSWFCSVIILSRSVLEANCTITPLPTKLELLSAHSFIRTLSSIDWQWSREHSDVGHTTHL